LVSFKLEGTVYTFDPNRMFTPVGVEATLKEYGPYSPIAAKHVLAFSQRLLEIYDFNRLPVRHATRHTPHATRHTPHATRHTPHATRHTPHANQPLATRQTVVTLHNNGPNYNASLYLPGGPFANEAEKVFIAPGAFARDFFFVTENAFFEKLKVQCIPLHSSPSTNSATRPTVIGSIDSLDLWARGGAGRGAERGAAAEPARPNRRRLAQRLRLPQEEALSQRRGRRCRRTPPIAFHFHFHSGETATTLTPTLRSAVS
jgi:hypothetical protein